LRDVLIPLLPLCGVRVLLVVLQMGWIASSTSRLHSQTESSPLPVARVRPSGLNAHRVDTARGAGQGWPSRVALAGR